MKAHACQNLHKKRCTFPTVNERLEGGWVHSDHGGDLVEVNRKTKEAFLRKGVVLCSFSVVSRLRFFLRPSCLSSFLPFLSLPSSPRMCAHKGVPTRGPGRPSQTRGLQGKGPLASGGKGAWGTIEGQAYFDGCGRRGQTNKGDRTGCRVLPRKHVASFWRIK
jgi:hypothetical protein